MNAIITYTEKRNKLISVVAVTASGKKSVINNSAFPAAFDTHRIAAERLSSRLGWGADLIGGETKQGFAFVPAPKQPKPTPLTQEMAANLIAETAKKFAPDCQDPIRLASGIRDLMKA